MNSHLQVALFTLPQGLSCGSFLIGNPGGGNPITKIAAVSAEPSAEMSLKSPSVCPTTTTTTTFPT